MKPGQKGRVICHTPTTCQTLKEHSAFVPVITAKDKSLRGVRWHDLTETKQGRHYQEGTLIPRPPRCACERFMLSLCKLGTSNPEPRLSLLCIHRATSKGLVFIHSAKSHPPTYPTPLQFTPETEWQQQR